MNVRGRIAAMGQPRFSRAPFGLYLQMQRRQGVLLSSVKSSFRLESWRPQALLSAIVSTFSKGLRARTLAIYAGLCGLDNALVVTETANRGNASRCSRLSASTPELGPVAEPGSRGLGADRSPYRAAGHAPPLPRSLQLNVPHRACPQAGGDGTAESPTNLPIPGCGRRLQFVMRDSPRAPNGPHGRVSSGHERAPAARARRSTRPIGLPSVVFPS
jgi:hypothetical protein